MSERERRVAENEARFRVVNEGIEHARSRLPEAPLPSFVCECGREDCAESIELTSAEYEAMRQSGNRFAIKPGHELADVEHVVERHETYLVIAKEGEASGLVEAEDPRA